MKKLSKHSYAHLNLTSHEIPGLDKIPVGSKHHFTIQAEHMSTEKHDATMKGLMIEGKGKKGEAAPKFSGRFKVTHVEHTPVKGGKKMPRYKA